MSDQIQPSDCATQAAAKILAYLEARTGPPDAQELATIIDGEFNPVRIEQRPMTYAAPAPPPASSERGRSVSKAVVTDRGRVIGEQG